MSDIKNTKSSLLERQMNLNYELSHLEKEARKKERYLADLEDELEIIEAMEFGDDRSAGRKSIRLGEWYRDILHGFIGCSIAYQQHITGCDRVFIEFQNVEGILSVRDADITTYAHCEPPAGCSVRPYLELEPSKVTLGATYKCNVTGTTGIACTITERIGFSDYSIRLDRRDEKDRTHNEHVWESDLEFLYSPSNDMATLKANVKKEQPGHIGSSMPGMGMPASD